MKSKILVPSAFIFAIFILNPKAYSQADQVNLTFSCINADSKNKVFNTVFEININTLVEDVSYELFYYSYLSSSQQRIEKLGSFEKGTIIKRNVQFLGDQNLPDRFQIKLHCFGKAVGLNSKFSYVRYLYAFKKDGIYLFANNPGDFLPILSNKNLVTPFLQEFSIIEKEESNGNNTAKGINKPDRLKIDDQTKSSLSLTTNISGYAFYKDKNLVNKPIRYANVVIKDEGSLLPLGNTKTDEFGKFEASVLSLELDGPDIYVEVYTNGVSGFPAGSTGITELKKEDNGETYLIVSNVYRNFTQGILTLPDLIEIGGITYPDWGAWSVFDTFVEGWIQSKNQLGIDIAKIESRWPISNNQAYFDNPFWFWLPNIIKIGQNFRFNKDVILHEYGHYIDYKYSLINGGGGIHTYGENLTSECRQEDANSQCVMYYTRKTAVQTALSEGWASFYAVAIQYNSTNDVTLDGFGSLENYFLNKGADNEVAVSSILWDLFDGGTVEKHDNLQVSLSDIWQTLIYDTAIDSVQQIASKWLKLNKPNFAELTKIFNSHEVSLKYIDKTPPMIIADGISYSNEINTNIMIGISEDIDPFTLDPSTIFIQGSKSPQITFNSTFDENYNIVINPIQDFAPQETITVTLTTSIKDLAGNGLDSNNDGIVGPNKVFSFSSGGYTHDYSVESVNVSNSSPIVGETVVVSAIIKNLGTGTELSNQRIYLYDNNNLVSTYPYFPSLGKTQSYTHNFNWIAVAGVHELKVKIELTGDENSANDFNTTSFFTGTAGNLIIDGAQNPVKDVTLNPGNQGIYTLQLQNIGSADIIAYVTKSGTNSDWVNLTDGSPILIKKGESKVYNYYIVAPSGTPPGNYSATILFTYEGGNKTAAITYSIKVISFVNGLFNDILDAGTYTIDGSSASVRVLTHAFGNLFSYDLDNDAATSYPSKVENTITFTPTEYATLNSAVWEIYILNEVKGSANMRLSVRTTSENGYKSYSSDINYTSNDIIGWFKNGTNSIRLSLDNFVIDRGDVAWKVDGSKQVLNFSKSAWSKDYSISSNNLNKWQDGWDYGRVYFKVNSVTDAGDIFLFINGIKASTKAISTSDVGKTLYFTFPSSRISTSNYINIKGDKDDNTKISISNLSFEVHYFDGEPNLKCTKTLSAVSANVNEEVSVNMLFENIGSNIADEPRYNDSPLPVGLSLVSGSSLNGDPGDINPGLSATATYRIKPTLPGNYTFGATQVTYDDLSNNSYKTSFNSLNLFVSGGNLLVEGEANKSIVGLNEKIGISSTVKGSILNSSVSDARVICTVKNTKTNQIYSSFYLVFNTSSQKYEGEFIETGTTGDYEITIAAEHDFYNKGNLLIPINVKIPYIDLNSNYASVEAVTGQASFIVNSNIPWSPSFTEDWITCNTQNNGSLSVTYLENTSGIPRTAVITLEGFGIIKIIIIEQRANVITVSENSKIFESKVYPNPTTGLLNIEINDSYPAAIRVKLICFSGEVIIDQPINGSIVDRKIMLDISNMPNGFYYLFIGNAKTHKIIKVIKH